MASLCRPLLALTLLTGCPGQADAPAPAAPVAAPAAPAEASPPRESQALTFDPAAFGAPPTWDPRASGAWPGVEEFRNRWEREAAGAEVVRVARGRVSVRGQATVASAVVAIAPAGDGAHRIEFLFADAGHDSRGLEYVVPGASWQLVAGSLDRPGSLGFERDGAELEIEAAHLSPIRPPDRAAFADRVYVRTLLASAGPLYDEVEAATNDRGYRDIAGEVDAAKEQGTAVARIRELARDGVNRWDDGWEHAAAVAESEGDPDLAHEIFRMYRPIGRCSMDDRPAEVARRYAEFCRRNRKAGCFLALRVRIMGDRFERVAYSSYGEAAASTQADELSKIGLDTDRFFRGLLVEFATDGDGSAIGLWRLARAIHEAGRAAALTASLTRFAADPAIDEYNRLRATIVLTWLAKLDGTPRAQIVERLEGLPLAPSSRAWLGVF